MPCYSPLLGWKDRRTGGLSFNRRDGDDEMEVSCGQCIGCRLDYSRMWAMRIVHEASMWEHHGGNCFVTLTYRDEAECTFAQWKKGQHVPRDWSLDKTHFQKFMKRLRKAFAPQRVRFFHVGEYGRKCKHGIDLTMVKCPLCFVGRPHYHACLFNCWFDDLEAYGSDGGELRYTSAMLEDIWGYGFVDVGEVNYASAAYGARYILKKISGPRAADHYMAYDLDGVVTFLQPEYTTMSRRPGIGYAWYKKYKSDVFPSDETPIPGYGVVKKVPRYYEELLKIEDPIALEEIKELRSKYREDNMDEYTPDRLMAKYKVKMAQIRSLERKL